MLWIKALISWEIRVDIRLGQPLESKVKEFALNFPLMFIAFWNCKKAYANKFLEILAGVNQVIVPIDEKRRCP